MNNSSLLTFKINGKKGKDETNEIMEKSSVC